MMPCFTSKVLQSATPAHPPQNLSSFNTQQTLKVGLFAMLYKAFGKQLYLASATQKYFVITLNSAT